MRSFSRLSSSSFAIAVLAFGFSTKQAFGNLVQNGGFEAGNISNWVLVDTSNTPSLTTVPLDPASAHTGNYHLKTGPNWHNHPNPTVATLTQSLPTVIGESYQLDFFLGNEIFVTPSPGTVLFQVSWDNSIIGSISPSVNAFSYTGFSAGGLLATSTSTELKFSFRHDPGFWHLDDVSVTVSPAGVPDAGGTLILMGLTFASLAFLRRRFG